MNANGMTMHKIPKLADFILSGFDTPILPAYPRKSMSLSQPTGNACCCCLTPACG